MLFLGAGNASGPINRFLRAGYTVTRPTNQFPENKKIKKIKNSKIEKKNILQPTNHHHKLCTFMVQFF
jgi:hypothetical protein